jgi:hypothetical protein
MAARRQMVKACWVGDQQCWHLSQCRTGYLAAKPSTGFAKTKTAIFVAETTL